MYDGQTIDDVLDQIDMSDATPSCLAGALHEGGKPARRPLISGFLKKFQIFENFVSQYPDNYIGRTT
jgi:hypothetical protein